MIIDAYQHLGLPRFQSPEDALAAMDHSSITRAMVCPFETCPDLAGVHHAFTAAPDRFLGLGIPIGRDRREVEAVVAAQLRAGFAGLRLSGANVRDSPWLLDQIGDADGIALVCGDAGLADGARTVLRFLEEYPQALAIGGHFAGPTALTIFGARPAVAELFAHERFFVIFSRQTLFEPATLTSWVRELIDRVGWQRIMWGSEAPVLYWRDESLADATGWIERFNPTDRQRAAFLGGTARRVLFDRPRPAAGDLVLPADPLDLTVVRPAAMWPHGLDLDDVLAGRLVHAWLDHRGMQCGTLGQYLADLLDAALPPAPPPTWTGGLDRGPGPGASG
jgi:Amidohydrolase